MRVLIACEFTGIVRDAFLARGHDAMSCDIIDTESPGPHYTGDVRDVLGDGWDLMIAHPPCQFLAVSGAKWWGNKHSKQDQDDALAFVQLLMDAPIARICIENPVSKIATAIIESDQRVQPHEHGHGETKTICLWFDGPLGLPKLKPTNIVEGRDARIHRMSPGPNRSKDRARFYSGIAAAMADQWGGLGDKAFNKWQQCSLFKAP